MSEFHKAFHLFHFVYLFNSGNSGPHNRDAAHRQTDSKQKQAQNVYVTVNVCNQ